MQTLNYWKQFEHTGRVEDYLSYVSEEAMVPGQTFGEGETTGMMRPQAPAVSGMTGEGEDKKGKAGADPYAGIHMGNRNDIETDAYRGI